MYKNHIKKDTNNYILIINVEIFLDIPIFNKVKSTNISRDLKYFCIINFNNPLKCQKHIQKGSEAPGQRKR